MTVFARFNSLYISLPSSAKQPRELTNSALSKECELRGLIVLKFQIFQILENLNWL